MIKVLHYDDLNIKITMGNMTINIFYIGYEPPIPNWGFKNHSHSTYELHFIPSGKGILQAFDKKFNIIPGTFYLTGPGIIHQQKADSENPMCEYCINFEVKISKGRIKKGDIYLKEEIDEIIKTLLNTNFWFGEDRFATSELFVKVMLELENSLTGYYTYTQNLLSLIVLNAIRCMTEQRKTNYYFPKKILNDSRIFLIDEEFIKDYLGLTPEKLANKIRTSVRQLNRVMKQQYNMTFTEKLTVTRIEKSKELLKETCLSIKEISERTGFANPNYFSRVFQKYQHTSPSEFREKLEL